MVTLKRNGQLQLLVGLKNVATVGTLRLDHAYLQIRIVESRRERVLANRSYKHTREVEDALEPALCCSLGCPLRVRAYRS